MYEKPVLKQGNLTIRCKSQYKHETLTFKYRKQYINGRTFDLDTLNMIVFR